MYSPCILAAWTKRQIFIVRYKFCVKTTIKVCVIQMELIDMVTCMFRPEARKMEVISVQGRPEEFKTNIVGDYKNWSRSVKTRQQPRGNDIHVGKNIQALLSVFKVISGLVIKPAIFITHVIFLKKNHYYAMQCF